MLQHWKIEPDRQSVLVRDGASNMVLGSELADIDDVHCNIHILQLVVNDCIFSQEYVRTSMLSDQYYARGSSCLFV